MSWLRFGKGLLVAGILSLSGVGVYADGCCNPCGAQAGCGTPCCAPQMTTVTVCEMVPEQYQAQVTKYRWEPAQETYTAYRQDMVAKPMTRTYCVNVPYQENYTVNVTKCRQVPYQQQVTTQVARWVDEPRTITVCRMVQEPQTIQVQVCQAYQEQVMMSRTVDRGSWQTQVVPCNTGCNSGCGSSCGSCNSCGNSCNSCNVCCDSGRRGLFGRRKGGNCCSTSCCTTSCCNSGCNTGCNDCCAPQTRCVQVWVPNCVTEQYPCTVTKTRWVTEPRQITVCRQVQEQQTITCKKCVYEPVVSTVTCYRTETYQEPVQCTRTLCRQEQRTENYTVQECVCTPYQATRTVQRCVAYQDTVTCTRMVPHYVQKQVPCNTCCNSGCNSGCNTCTSGCGTCSNNDCCATSCCSSKRRGLCRKG